MVYFEREREFCEEFIKSIRNERVKVTYSLTRNAVSLIVYYKKKKTWSKKKKRKKALTNCGNILTLLLSAIGKSV